MSSSDETLITAKGKSINGLVVVHQLQTKPKHVHAVHTHYILFPNFALRPPIPISIFYVCCFTLLCCFLHRTVLSDSTKTHTQIHCSTNKWGSTGDVFLLLGVFSSSDDLIYLMLVRREETLSNTTPPRNLVCLPTNPNDSSVEIRSKYTIYIFHILFSKSNTQKALELNGELFESQNILLEWVRLTWLNCY